MDGQPQINVEWNEHLHASVHRAVGGCLNLVRELSRISEQLDPSVPSEWLIKRILFFAYELQTRVQKEASERDRLAALNFFFFEDKKFRCLSDSAKRHALSEAYRLNHVLMTRSGAPTVLALIYAFLAERIGLSLEFVDLKPTCFLKWTEDGRSRFIDIIRGGSTLSSDELIEMLHSRFQMTSFCNTSLLETFSFDTYLADYISELKFTLLPKNEPEKLLFLQNILIAYQPSNIQLLGERALLHRRLGEFKNALSDLKRYFTFHERDKAPPELVRIFEELTLMETTPNLHN